MCAGNYYSAWTGWPAFLQLGKNTEKLRDKNKSSTLYKNKSLKNVKHIQKKIIYMQKIIYF